MNKYHLAVVIGRFQPFHIIHKQLVEQALLLGERVLILLGSAKKAPNVKNPFTPALREKMIRSCYSPEENKRLIFKPLRDYPYNETNWISEVQNIVRTEQEGLLGTQTEEFDAARHNLMLGQIKTALVGRYKDSSSYYLKIFPQWTFEEIATDPKTSSNLSATDIRDDLFSNGVKWKRFVPKPVERIIIESIQSDDFNQLKKEFDYITKYREDTKFVGVNFPATFVTTDAVCIARGHLLLVRRGRQPGIGQLALPGGFVAQGARLKENCIRELRQETRINVEAAVLRRAIIASEVFDHPDRSQRGRTITHAFFLELYPRIEDGLPIVKGDDDASAAFWLPISALGDVEDEFFEDHYDIIRYFIDTPSNRES